MGSGGATGGVDEDGLAGAPGVSGGNIFEAPYGDLPECFHISPEAQAHYPLEIQRAIYNVKFIHYHQKQQDKFDEVSGCDLTPWLSGQSTRLLISMFRDRVRLTHTMESVPHFT